MRNNKSSLPGLTIKLHMHLHELEVTMSAINFTRFNDCGYSIVETNHMLEARLYTSVGIWCGFQYMYSGTSITQTSFIRHFDHLGMISSA